MIENISLMNTNSFFISIDINAFLGVSVSRVYGKVIPSVCTKMVLVLSDREKAHLRIFRRR